MAETSVETVLLLFLIFAAFALIIKTALDLRNSIQKRSHELAHRLSSLEKRAIEIKKEMDELHKEINAKVEHEELEKRIDKLIQLLSKK